MGRRPSRNVNVPRPAKIRRGKNFCDAATREESGMRVSDVMSRDVEFIAPDEIVREAAVLMGELDVGALPVGTATDIEGVITDRDILYRVVAAGLDPNATTVGA